MFRIADGREYFYQWDVDRQLVVEDSSIAEVHYCNRTDDCSLVVEVKDGLADVPNVILQKSFDFRVFGYDGKATRYDAVFEVKARTKPTDYVYTEVEIKRYEDLSKRIDKIEEEGITQEAIDDAVGKYLEENPIETVTKVSQLENDSNFITLEDVPKTDLSEYAKKSDIPDISDFISEIPSEYVTETELAAKGYATEKYVDDAIADIAVPEADLSNYYTKEEAHTNYSDAKEVFYFDFSGVVSGTTNGRDATEEEAKVFNRLKNGENLTAYVRYSTSREIYAVADIRRVSSSSFDFKLHYTFMAETNVTQVVEFKVYLLSSQVWRIIRDSVKSYTFATEEWVQDQSYATKDYVDSLFEGIATAEGGAY